MKRVKSTQLEFKDSKSNKVYEVDLCDVGTGYVVNFRYGRRGKTLKEGTKTDQPIPLEKAEATFEKLIASKKKKGYIEMAAAPSVDIPPVTPWRDIEDARERGIIRHLSLEVENPNDPARKNWKISRVMWRAGQFRLHSALPYIMQLHDKSDDIHQLSAIWAMGRCGITAAQAPVLEHYAKGHFAQNVQNLANTILLQILTGEAYDKHLHFLMSKLPPALRAKLQEKDDSAFQAVLQQMTFVEQKKSYDFLVYLYILADAFPHTKAALIDLLAEVKLAPPYFKSIRAIFKLAEYKDDGQFFGLLAYRFEEQAAMFKHTNYGVYANNQWINDAQAELKKANPKLAYSNKTKAYFNRRIWKHLERLVAEKDTSYVSIAAGILLAHPKSDEGVPTKEVRWDFNKKKGRYYKSTIHYDVFAEKKLMNFILYKNSPRYHYNKRIGKWQCTGDYKPGMPAPNVREEACPELWDKVPTAYTHLLVKGEMNPILEFALRGLLQHPQYPQLKAKMDNAFLERIFSKAFTPVLDWALDVAKEKYNAKQPDTHFTLFLLGHTYSKARKVAMQWVEENPSLYFTQVPFITQAITSPIKDIRDWIKEQLPQIVSGLTDNRKEVLVGQIIVKMMDVKKSENGLAEQWGNVLLEHFKDTISHLGFGVIKDLAQHKLEANQRFAGQVLLQHNTTAEDIPTPIFEQFLYAKKSYNRTVGIELLGRFSDNTLLGRQKELVQYATSRYVDVRQAIRPTIQRLAQKYTSFAADCVNTFIPVLLRKETYPGVHQDVLALMTQELEPHLSIVERKRIFRLLNSPYTPAQELGTLLVDKYIPADTLSIENIIRLGNHEIRACREICWRMFRENAARIRYERDAAIRILDAKWDDTRDFAFTFFREQFKEKDWTPKILVSICDSVREDVQAFGRELITKFFQEEDGTAYLLQLSQHPKIELQLFASNYLERFAADDLDKIKQLELYFTTVLTQVNKGRTAKNRVLTFLRNEALKNKEVASLVARMLERLSLTQAIGDKAASIAIMRDIHQQYPDIPLVITVATPTTVQDDGRTV